jgi:hypothetical protein
MDSDAERFTKFTQDIYNNLYNENNCRASVVFAQVWQEVLIAIDEKRYKTAVIYMIMLCSIHARSESWKDAECSKENMPTQNKFKGKKSISSRDSQILQILSSKITSENIDIHMNKLVNTYKVKDSSTQYMLVCCREAYSACLKTIRHIIKNPNTESIDSLISFILKFLDLSGCMKDGMI